MMLQTKGLTSVETETIHFIWDIQIEKITKLVNGKRITFTKYTYLDESSN